MSEAKVIDLFCGVGGLTYGLEQAGLNVVEGVDLDERCQYPYEANTEARFVAKDVRHYGAEELRSAWDGAELRILVGCAPCQRFSTYARGCAAPSEFRSRWGLIDRFVTLVEEALPDIVSMENVPPLAGTRVFRSFVDRLEAAGYNVDSGIADCRTYGAPQTRRRLVLLASRLGPIELVPPSHSDSSTWKDCSRTLRSV